jgi:NAD(P)-dependent dehydrogenase (short-subunit alcohol dehydrogenase family)
VSQTVLITGGSRGIGLATALRFARARANVVLAARDPAALRRAAEQVVAAGGSCATVACDVGTRAGAESAVQTAGRLGRLNVLVNNAGVAPVSSIPDYADGDFERVQSVNCASVFYLTRAAWPLLRAAAPATIVNVSSQASADPFPGLSVYGASKAWVNLFTQATAAEGKPHAIRAFAVAPGAVDTEMLRAVIPDFPAQDALAADDVARVIEWLCDERVEYASGQTVFLRK